MEIRGYYYSTNSQINGTKREKKRVREGERNREKERKREREREREREFSLNGTICRSTKRKRM